jgi:hypothetical protein
VDPRRPGPHGELGGVLVSILGFLVAYGVVGACFVRIWARSCVCRSDRPSGGVVTSQHRRAPIEDARAGRGWWDLGRRVEPWACSASFRARGRWGGTNRGISVFCIPPQNIPAARSRASTVGFTLLSHSYRTTLYLCVDEVPAPRSRPTTVTGRGTERGGLCDTK